MRSLIIADSAAAARKARSYAAERLLLMRHSAAEFSAASGNRVLRFFT